MIMMCILRLIKVFKFQLLFCKTHVPRKYISIWRVNILFPLKIDFNNYVLFILAYDNVNRINDILFCTLYIQWSD